MLYFCGQDKVLIDANGRIKFNSRVLSDFVANGGLDVVLHCLPEGAVAIYPESAYSKMRNDEPKIAEMASTSIVYRRIMRRFGSLSKSEKISAQGRITIPIQYRQYADLEPGSEALIIGCEIGIEIWNAERWIKELEILNEHAKEKGEREMSADLDSEELNVEKMNKYKE